MEFIDLCYFIFQLFIVMKTEYSLIPPFANLKGSLRCTYTVHTIKQFYIIKMMNEICVHTSTIFNHKWLLFSVKTFQSYDQSFHQNWEGGLTLIRHCKTPANVQCVECRYLPLCLLYWLLKQTRLFVHSSIHSLIHWFIDSFIHSLVIFLYSN